MTAFGALHHRAQPVGLAQQAARLIEQRAACLGEARALKEVVAEQALELRLLKKSMIADGGDGE